MAIEITVKLSDGMAKTTTEKSLVDVFTLKSTSLTNDGFTNDGCSLDEFLKSPQRPLEHIFLLRYQMQREMPIDCAILYLW